jgi:hypothetical protein
MAKILMKAFTSKEEVKEKRCLMIVKRVSVDWAAVIM